MNTKLPIPREPIEIKDYIKYLEKLEEGSDIAWDSLNVWYGNKLPKCLWDQWQKQLKNEGFTWQIFLKVLKYRTDKFILWAKGMITWTQLVIDVEEIIIGPVGQSIVRSRIFKNSKNIKT